MSDTTEAMLSRNIVDASQATDRESWLEAIDSIGEEAGYFQSVGRRHWAFFVDESPTLIVTFETIDAIRQNPGQMPLGHHVAKANGWSHLCLIADGETWYRDPAVYGYFDRLVDDAFFEDFDSVVFYGAGMGGYAACAYSVTAPGATVVAIAPRATLHPKIAGWDHRHKNARRLDFTSRYGFAPDMTDGAGQVFVLHDPEVAADAMHATLFDAPYVTHLHTRHLGEHPETHLIQMGQLTPILEAAAKGTFSRRLFSWFWRARRKHVPYLKTLLSRARVSHHPEREFKICNNVTRRLNNATFRKRLVQLETERN